MIDLSSLTCIDIGIINRLVDLSDDCICHSVVDSIKSKESTTEIDIGIGTIYILVEEGSTKYKFIPSEELERKVCTSVKTRKSPLVKRVEKSLVKNIERTYKDLL
jgi:hypothetical protein